MGRLAVWTLGLSLREATFARRGFRECAASTKERLEEIGASFIFGYNAALARAEEIENRLAGVSVELRGFAFEGAAMGLTLLDTLSPIRKSRWRVLLEGAGEPHLYMIYVGAGWAAARLRLRVAKALQQKDPLLGWLLVDGYGFHEGYFRSERSIKNQLTPNTLNGYALRAFDQGLGRSMWFVLGASVCRIKSNIAQFPPIRRPDLWSGVGLASAYAGGIGRTELELLKRAASPYEPETAQGAAFAAEARRRAGNITADTEIACAILCGMSADDAAKVTQSASINLPFDREQPAYEYWRERVRSRFAKVKCET